jgi:hypothetical protein
MKETSLRHPPGAGNRLQHLRGLASYPLSPPTGLWYALAGSFVLPVLVYAVSVVHAQRSM